MEKEDSPLDLMRQLCGKDGVIKYLQTILEEINANMAGIENAVREENLTDAFEQLHTLKHSFQCINFQAGAKACDALTNNLQTGCDIALTISNLKMQSTQAKSIILREPEMVGGKTI